MSLVLKLGESLVLGSSHSNNSCLTRTPLSKKEAIYLFPKKVSCSTSKNLELTTRFYTGRDKTRKRNMTTQKMTLHDILKSAMEGENEFDAFGAHSSCVSAPNLARAVTSDSTIASATPTCLSAPPASSGTMTKDKTLDGAECPATPTTVSTTTTTRPVTARQRYSLLLSAKRNNDEDDDEDDDSRVIDQMYGSISSRDYFHDEDNIVLCAPDSVSSMRQKFGRDSKKIEKSNLSPKLEVEGVSNDDDSEKKKEESESKRDQSRSKRRTSLGASRYSRRSPNPCRSPHSSTRRHSIAAVINQRQQQQNKDSSPVACHSVPSSRRGSDHSRSRALSSVAASSYLTPLDKPLACAAAAAGTTNDDPAMLLFHLETALADAALSMRAISHALLRTAASSTAAAQVPKDQLPRIPIAMAALKEVEGVLKQYRVIRSETNHLHGSLSHFSQLPPPPLTASESGEQRKSSPTGSKEKKSKSASSRHKKATSDVEGTGERSHDRRKSRSHSLSQAGRRSRNSTSRLHVSDGKLISSRHGSSRGTQARRSTLSKHAEQADRKQEEGRHNSSDDKAQQSGGPTEGDRDHSISPSNNGDENNTTPPESSDKKDTLSSLTNTEKGEKEEDPPVRKFPLHQSPTSFVKSFVRAASGRREKKREEQRLKKTSTTTTAT